jgi:hypothetical protein
MCDVKDIRRLYKQGQWDNIYKLIISNKCNLLEHVYNGQNIIHLSAMNNKYDILKHIINKHTKLLKNGNIHGYNVLHIFAINGFIQYFKDFKNKLYEFINLVDNNNASPIMEGIEHIDLIYYILTEYNNVDVDIINNSNDTILTLLIKSNQDTKDILKCINIIKNINGDLNHPENNRPITVAINKNNVDIINCLTNKIDINYVNNNYSTLLSELILNKHVKIANNILDNISIDTITNDINLCNVFKYISDNNEHDILRKLINKLKHHINTPDKNLTSPVHILFKEKNTPHTIINDILQYADINVSNNIGITPLYYLAKYHKLNNFMDIIKTKHIDANKIISTPHMLKYINDDTFNQIKKIIKTSPSTNHNITLNKYIVNDTDTDDKIYTFGSSVEHNAIYTLYLINKFKNIIIPFQNNESAINNFEYKLKYENFYYNDISIISVLKAHFEIFPEIVPQLIIWKNKYNYYIHYEFSKYIEKCINKFKARFIYLKVSFIIGNGLHSNIMLFDKNTMILERFEPYGYISSKYVNDFDTIIPHVISEIVNEITDKKLTYIHSHCNDIYSFQTLSDERDIYSKKMYDPDGYCLAWSVWYIHMRLDNPNTPSCELIKQLKKHIIESNTLTKHNSYMSHIRSFSHYLNNIKKQYMINAGISEDDISNVYINHSNKNKLKLFIHNEFEKLSSTIK